MCIRDSHLFVQNERSKRYLSKIGINRVTVVGDTRFDRVLQIREAVSYTHLDVYKRQDFLVCRYAFSLIPVQ